MSSYEKDRDRERTRDRDRDRDRNDREEGVKKESGKDKEAESKDDSFSEFQKALEMHNNAKKRKDAQPEPKPENKGANLISQTSLEAAAKKQKAEEATKKPVFLSKKEREEAALAKLEEKRKSEQKAKEELEKQRLEFELASRSRHQDRRREKDRELDRRKEEAEKKARTEQRNSLAVHKQQEKYLQVLKEAYLGKKKVKKTVIPPSQKFKFSFDWEPTEDTSIELNSLYDSKHKVSLLYGRGFMGGVDRREQRKGNSFYDELIKNREDNDSSLLKDQEEEALRRGNTEQQKKENSASGSSHWSEKKLEQMQDRDWQTFLDDFMISVKGNDIPKPLRYWKEARLPEEIQMALVTSGYREPTALQRQAIPVQLQGQDLIAIAEHGAGRTAAYVIPTLCNVSKLPKLASLELRARGPYVVVLATKERVKAIQLEFTKFLKGHTARCVALVDGMPLGEVVSQLKEGAEIIVGTPERVADNLDKRILALVQCACVIFDQCSRLLAGRNAEAQITQILEAAPSNDPEVPQDAKSAKKGFAKIVRQTILFSAAMPGSMESMAKKFLREPVFIAIGESSTSGHIKQKVSFLDDDKEKVAKLFLTLEEEEGPFVVFVNSKQTCERLAGLLKEKLVRVAVLHGSVTEEERKASIESFEKGELAVLVVSDRAEKATEGLTAVKHVIVFNIGTEIDKYAQRIARSIQASTGKGCASVFICEEDNPIFYDLKEYLKENGQPVPYRLNTHGASKNRTAAVVMEEN